MVFIPDSQDFGNYITGEGPSAFDEQEAETPVLGGGAGAPAGAGTTQAGGQGIQAEQQTAREQAGAGQVGTAVASREYPELLQPWGQRFQEQRQGLGATESQFYEAAGPDRTYQGIGAEGTLGGALQVGATPEQIEAARNVAWTEYGGPTQLDPERVARLRTELSALGSEAPTFTTSTGIGQLLTSQTPGLTPQEAAYEARLVQRSPGYKQAAVQSQQDINALLSRFVTAQEGAQARGQERTSQEEAIRGQAQQYLTGRGEEVEGQLASAIAQGEERNRKIADLSEQYFRTGDRALLDQLQELGATKYQIQDVRYPNEVERGDEPRYEAVQEAWDPSQLDTQAYRAAQYAQNVRDAIDEKYADIKDIPVMNLGATSHGRATLKFDPEWEKANKQNYTPEEWAALEQRILAREDEYNKLFGGRVGGRVAGPIQGTPAGYRFVEDPASVYGYRMAYEDLGPDATEEERRKQELTALYNISPQYLGGPTPEEAAFKGPDPRDYAIYLEGMSPTRASVSNEEQRHVINTVNDLLDKIDRLEEAEKPFEAAQIALGVEKFLDDENTILEARADELDTRRQNWAKTVRKARKRYLKAKKRSFWGKVARIVTGVGTLGLSEVVGASTGINPGEQLGYAAFDAFQGPGPRYPTPQIAPREDLPQGKGEIGLQPKDEEDEETT